MLPKTIKNLQRENGEEFVEKTVRKTFKSVAQKLHLEILKVEN